MNSILYTIGYEGRNIKEYISILSDNKIQHLCDVRRNAFSRKKGFSGKALKAACGSAGIEYAHLSGLGIDASHRKDLPPPKHPHLEEYKKLFAEYKPDEDYVRALEWLIQKHKRVAITCYEADHQFCHRSVLAGILNMEAKHL